jgi:spore coat protein U-like protein
MNAKLIAAAATVAALLGAAAASANTTTGTIQLRGSVASTCTIAVTDAAQSLNIVSGESNKQVGSIVENCNNGTGYVVTISSANQGVLKTTSGASTPAYTLRYDSQSGTLASALAVTRDGAQFNREVTVGVTLPASANAVAGSYSDTLTLTIATK